MITSRTSWKILTLSVALVWITASGTVAHAALIYDNGPLALGGANQIGTQSDHVTQSADDFVLTFGNTITGIRWWSTNSIPVDDFTIQFFQNDGSRPAEDPLISLAIGDVQETPVSFGSPFDEIFEYMVDIDPITLDLNVSYWISIFNSTDRTWFWAVSGLGNNHFRNSFFPDWTASGFPSAFGFSLFGPVAVPEPSTALLLLAGLAGFAFSSRRRMRERARASR